MKPDFLRFSTMLVTEDVAKTAHFYREHLGLEVSIDLGWFLSLKSPSRDVSDFEISFCAADHGFLPAAARTPAAGTVLAFQFEDVAPIHQAMTEADLCPTPLKDEPWGQRHFFVQGPDGVLLDIFMTAPFDEGWMREHGFI